MNGQENGKLMAHFPAPIFLPVPPPRAPPQKEENGRDGIGRMIYPTGMATAKLFRDGRSQAVRIPKEFRFDESTTEVFVRRMGQAVVLIPKQDSWDVLFDAIDALSPDFMTEGREQPERMDEEDLELLIRRSNR